jgi:hypothetical protein|eukprot:gene1903-1379_t
MSTRYLEASINAQTKLLRVQFLKWERHKTLAFESGCMREENSPRRFDKKQRIQDLKQK